MTKINGDLTFPILTNKNVERVWYENALLFIFLLVKLLFISKQIAVDIENEAHDQNRLLDGVDGDFDSGGSLLGGSRNRLAGVMAAGKQNRKFMCYVAIGIVVFIFLFYRIFSGGSG